MARTKYEKIRVITPTNRGTFELCDIVNTYLEDIPHIKYKYKDTYYLILADSKYIFSIIHRIWHSMAIYQMHTYISKEYSYYKSDNGYCYFYSDDYSYVGSYPYSDDNTIRLRRKNLKMLWD